MGLILRGLLGAGCLALTVARVTAGADPWIGKPQTEIATLLGPADRTSHKRDGRTILSYKLVRLHEGALAGPDLIVLDVPGVGQVARVTHADDPFKGETVGIEPAGVDERGNPVTGGLTTTRTASTSWNPKEGPPPSPAARPRDLPIKDKLKLTFEIDPAGRIAAWSIDPPVKR
jgi:hypothetical protein